MCAAAVNIERKCPMIASKNLFFKSLTKIKLSDDVADFRLATQGLACSNKHGCILAAFRNSFIILRAEDVWSAQLQAESSNSKIIELSQIPHLNVQNGSLGSTPSIVAISSDEEYLATDTIRNGHSFVIVFKLSSFLHQRGNCRPFCEIRGSAKPDAKIASICWNPGESLHNMVAISSSDSSLILAKIVRENTIENWVINEGVLTICWSPKGKQLVVGKTDGNLNQLKLDLTEAKKIPGPGGCIPTSIYWSSTTQFVVVFDSSSEISVMVVDIIKGAPVHYTNYDDVFMSDTVTYQTRCFFIPLTDWRCLISITNSSSDVLLLGKDADSDPWALLDIPDNKRAGLPIDNYSLGAAVYLGQKHNVVISDSEQYGPMPVLYLLSQTGSLFSFLLINSDPGAKSLVSAVVDPIPESIFSSQNQPATASPSVPPPSVSFQTPSAVPLPTFAASPINVPVAPSSTPLQAQPLNQNFAAKFSPQPQKPLIPTSNSTPQALQSNIVSPQVSQIKPLPQQGLPTAKELEQVKSILTERLVETNTLSDEAQEYQNLLIDVQKFEQRLSNFKQMQAADLISIEEKLEESCKFFDANIIGNMKTAENFVKDVEETTTGQKEEVEILKEKILYQLSNLEYAKSVLQQSEDLRCMHLMRSQSLDPITLSKFQKIEKLHLYVRNQVTEAQRFFYYNKPEMSIPKRQEPTAAQFIYQTLANHSQILRRLTQEVEKVRSALKLKKESSQVPKDWFKVASDLRPVEDSILNTSESAVESSPKSNTKLDSICLEDLMSGIRSVKLNSDSGDESNKPVVFTHEKLAALSIWAEEPLEINCEYDEGETNSKSVFNLGSLYDEVDTLKNTKETKSSIEGGGDNINFSTGEIPELRQSLSQPFKNLSQLSANQRAVSFSLASDQPQVQQPLPSSFFSMSSKIDTLQGGDNKLTGTVHPLPISDTVFNSTSAIKLKPFGLGAEATSLATGSNVTITPMKFSAFAPADSVTPLSSTDKPLLFNTETSVLTGLSKSSELTITASDSKNASPKPSSSLFGIPSSSASLTITSGFASGSQASLTSSPSFFGGASMFGQSGIKSPASTDTPITASPQVILGGVPPSVTVKSIATPPKVSSSSSSSTSDESTVEQKVPPTTQPLTILSTPKPNVGLWGVSTGTFSVQSQEQAPTTSTSATTNASLFSSAPAGSTTIAGGSPKEVPTLLSMQKPVGASQSFTVVTPTPLNTSQSSPLFTKSESPTSLAKLKETPPPESTAPIVSTPKSIFGGVSSPISTAAAITPIATTTATPVPATSFLSSTPTTSIASSTSLFGNPPASLSSTGLFGSSGLFSTPATTSSVTPPPTTSLFRSSLTTPTTTTGTTASFTTSGLFASSSPTKSIFGGGSTIITSTVPTAATPTTSTSLFSSTAPQTTSTGLFSSLPTATLTPTSSVAPLAPTTTTAATAGLFSSAASSTNIFGGSSFGAAPTSTTTTTAASIFGSPAPGIFGSPFGGNTTTTPSSPFGDQSNQNVQSPFGGTTSSNTQSPFGGTTTVPPNQSPFASSNTASSTSVFGGGGNVSSPFGGSSAIAPSSPFGGSSNISATPASPFGAASTTSATSPSIFGQSQQSSVFGGAPSSTASVFGGSAAFGSSPAQQNTSLFGQSTSASVFGGKPAFGGSAPFGSQSAFGSPSASSPTSSIFGTSSFGNTSTQPESIFGGSSFGLGAKPSADGANRNVFGGSTTYGGTPTPGIFGGSSSGGIASSGSALSPGSGAFSAGGAGVAQTGFGAAAVKPAAAGFGGSATFGSAPAFGSTPFGPAFGSTASPTAAFGGATTGAGSIFGGGTQQTGPTFGALAQSTNQSTFGGFSSPPPNAAPFGQQQQQSPSFGGGTSFSSWR